MGWSKGTMEPQGFALDELMIPNNQPADAGCLRCGAGLQESLVIQSSSQCSFAG